ncbi:hypothetical protein [Marivirga sp.]|uniref:hypothetical protein n=1 Tax=Marivirga sp. TaxID=2018662 RepID=UPI003DA73E6B
MQRFSILVVALILFASFKINAQDKPAALIKGESASVSENLIKLETFYPNLLGISYEKKIRKEFSIYCMMGFLGHYGGGSISQATYGVSSYYVLTPQVMVQPRFYHNLSKRAASDKCTAYNSANYVGFAARFYDEGLFITNAENYPKGPAIFDLMLSYGLQRNFFSRLNFDMAIQPGIEFTSAGAGAFIGINLQLGFIVFSN